MISRRKWLGTTICAAAALAFYHVQIAGERLVSPPRVVADQITLAANPDPICYDSRTNPYLNFDLIVRNGTEERIQVSELRAFVLDPNDELLERRVAARETLALQLLQDAELRRHVTQVVDLDQVVGNVTALLGSIARNAGDTLASG